MTRQEHDHVFNSSCMRKQVGPPSRDFLDRHWENMVSSDVSNVHRDTFRRVLEEEWREKGPEIMKDIFLSNN